MKKFVVFTLLLLMATTMGTAFAAVGNSRSDTAALYGEYRIVVDADNQLWTKLDWEQSGHKYAKEATLWHQFWRNEQGFQMVAAYETGKPDSVVQIQRFTPQSPFKLSEVKTLFPEIHKLLMSPKTVIFATDQQITSHFVESKPEIILGAVIKEAPTADRQAYYTLVSFNVVQEGRVVKHIDQINADTLIREFVMERVSKADVDNKLQERSGWTVIPNHFK
ncbi:MAG: hypothetical protein K0Q77_3041 [Anaerosporomusa subterranea]|jgi:hypothetical protein|nr:hypothetical protein [Anaerosporomusa subterranea]